MLTLAEGQTPRPVLPLPLIDETGRKSLWVSVKAGLSLPSDCHWPNRLHRLKYIWIVRNKDPKPEKDTSAPPLLKLCCAPSLPPPQAARGGCGLQSGRSSFSLLLLPRPFSLLQCESSPRLQSFGENLLQPGPSMGRRSFGKDPPALARGPAQHCAVGICSSMVLSGAAGESLLWHLEQHLSLLLRWPGCSFAGLVFTCFSPSLPVWWFRPFLRLFFLRSCQHGWEAQLCPAVGPSKPSMSSTGRPLAPSHRDLPATETCHLHLMQQSIEQLIHWAVFVQLCVFSVSKQVLLLCWKCKTYFLNMNRD